MTTRLLVGYAIIGLALVTLMLLAALATVHRRKPRREHMRVDLFANAGGGGREGRPGEPIAGPASPT
ncbi:MAG TPA: hypothetical protein VFR28_03065 [Allosphingosinicella sp.]|jgi:hypothetical protein|nr:hypothetical protein [Allosphingosinicella sp.]